MLSFGAQEKTWKLHCIWYAWWHSDILEDMSTWWLARLDKIAICSPCRDNDNSWWSNKYQSLLGQGAWVMGMPCHQLCTESQLTAVLSKIPVATKAKFDLDMLTKSWWPHQKTRTSDNIPDSQLAQRGKCWGNHWRSWQFWQRHTCGHENTQWPLGGRRMLVNNEWNIKTCTTVCKRDWLHRMGNTKNVLHPWQDIWGMTRLQAQ